MKAGLARITFFSHSGLPIAPQFYANIAVVKPGTP
jgi:hypothetical protein